MMPSQEKLGRRTHPRTPALSRRLFSQRVLQALPIIEADEEPKRATDLTTKNTNPGQIVHLQEFEQFAQWMALPKRLRDPETHGDMAKQLGVAPDTLSDWKKRDDFWARVKEYRSTFLKETIPDVLDAAIQAAKRDSFNDRKLLLEMAQEYLPVTRQEVTGKDGGPMQVQTLVGIVQEARQGQPDPESA